MNIDFLGISAYTCMSMTKNSDYNTSGKLNPIGMQQHYRNVNNKITMALFVSQNTTIFVIIICKLLKFIENLHMLFYYKM